MSKLRDTIAAAPWAAGLSPAQRLRVESETFSRTIPKGGFVCRRGQPADHWIVVVDGLVKLSSVSPSGKPTTFTAVPAGGWFGEGSLLKDEPRRYDATALRDSVAGYMPRPTFHSLLDENLAFARFLLVQLNERLGQFIGMVESERILGPDARVAHCLAGLYNPTLYPGMGGVLEISQEEIAHLAGLSRQTVNHALKVLEERAIVRVSYRGIAILKLEELARYQSADAR